MYGIFAMMWFTVIRDLQHDNVLDMQIFLQVVVDV